MIYFIWDGERHIKIGHSTNPTARMATLQTGTTAKLGLLHQMPGDVADEKLLHYLFQDLRKSGEWFEDDPSFYHFLALAREPLCSGMRAAEVVELWREEILYEGKCNVLYDEHEWA